MTVLDPMNGNISGTAMKQLRNSLKLANSSILVYFTCMDFSEIFSIVFRLSFLASIKLQFSLNVTSENKKNQEHKIMFLWHVCFVNFSLFTFSDSKWRFCLVLISCRSPAQSRHHLCSICTIMPPISLSLLLAHVSLAASSYKLVLPVMKFLPFPPILTTL